MYVYILGWLKFEIPFSNFTLVKIGKLNEIVIRLSNYLHSNAVIFYLTSYGYIKKKKKTFS